jgi:hypothetical protein
VEKSKSSPSKALVHPMKWGRGIGEREEGKLEAAYTECEQCMPGVSNQPTCWFAAFCVGPAPYNLGVGRDGFPLPYVLVFPVQRKMVFLFSPWCSRSMASGPDI